MLGVTIVCLMVGLVFLTGSFYCSIIMEIDEPIITLLLFISMIGVWIAFASPATRFEDSIKNQCKDAHVSYELVESIADATDESEHDIVVFCKYAAGVDMDLVDAIMIIDPDLSEEEAAAIVTTSDLKQSKEN
jgi:hypothetical protein